MTECDPLLESAHGRCILQIDDMLVVNFANVGSHRGCIHHAGIQFISIGYKLCEIQLHPLPLTGY